VNLFADPPRADSPTNFATLFEKAPDAMLLADDDRAFVAGNRRARELLQVTPQQLRLMRIDDFLPEGVDGAWTAFRERGESDGCWIIRSLDGSEHAVEIHAQADLEPGRHLAILRPVAPQRAGVTGTLSGREREVLRLLATGATATEIARNLFLSRATVATHVRNAMLKLGAHTRVEAVVIALRTGEIDV
jgi:DNA-binding CsgD family transcriptional regulator